MPSVAQTRNCKIKLLIVICIVSLGSYAILYISDLNSFHLFLKQQINTSYTKLFSFNLNSFIYKVPDLKSHTTERQVNNTVSRNYRQQFIINTDGCKIPYIDPFNPTYAHVLKPALPLKCPKIPQIVEIINYTLRINANTLAKYFPNDTLSYCSYESISRNNDGTDNKYKFGSSRFFNLKQPMFNITDEFFRIHCLNKKKQKIYTNYHSVVLRTPEREQRAKLNSESCVACANKTEHLNIAAIALDGTASANLKRMCPKLYKYVTESLKMIELQVYHKLADNTLVNLLPFFTGKFLKELGWKSNLKNKFFDSYNFIWKNFSRQGYRTFFVEDYPKIGTFNYLKPGFKNQPFDYYGRPFALAVENEFLKNRCMGSKLQADAILDTTAEFMKVYGKDKYFVFSFTGRLTHDRANEASTAEEPYLNFFKKVSPILNDTVMIFFSDHGARVGSYRKTYFGRLEERLPFLFIYFPSWFKKKYPSLIETVKINSKRLTTHFDLYETMKDILHFNPELIKRNLSTSPPPRAYSLFNEIPTSRTCENAGIDIQWCTCENFDPEDISNPVAIRAANALVNEINKRIYHIQHLCATLSLGEISEVRKSTAESHLAIFNKNIGEKDKQKGIVVNYQLVLETEPNKGVFEGIVSYHKNNDSFEITSDISRINKYGNQSDCINEYFLKKYCYCILQ